jgi:Na+/H+-dicarboxylate symporter
LLFNWLFGAGDPQQVPLTGISKWLQEVLVDSVFDAIGQIFIKSLKLLVVPMVFVSLVCGSASLGGHSRVGVMALKTIVLYLTTTALAITLALAMGSLVRPGDGIDLVSDTSFSALAAPSLKETFINIFPSTSPPVVLGAMFSRELIESG